MTEVFFDVPMASPETLWSACETVQGGGVAVWHQCSHSAYTTIQHAHISIQMAWTGIDIYRVVSCCVCFAGSRVCALEVVVIENKFIRIVRLRRCLLQVC